MAPIKIETPKQKTPEEILADILNGNKQGTDGTGTSGSVSKDKETNIAWRITTAGNVKEYKTITQAKNYLTVKSPEYNLVKSNWQALQGTDLKSKTVTSFWKKVVDLASANDSSPWDIMNAYLKDPEAFAPTNTTNDGSGKYIPQVSVSLLDRGVADSIINSAILSTYGRQATDAERNTFFKEYNAQAKAGTVTKTVKKGGKLVTTTTKKFDDQAFQQKYVAGILNQALATDEGADLGGDAGKLQDQLRSYADDMGMSMSDSQVNSYVRRVFNQELTADDAVSQIRDKAMVLYKPYADDLKADSSLTVRKLASPYIGLIQDRWELANERDVSLNDAMLQKFIANGYSIGEADKEIKQTAQYRNSTAAQKQGANLGTMLASAMGF